VTAAAKGRGAGDEACERMVPGVLRRYFGDDFSSIPRDIECYPSDDVGNNGNIEWQPGDYCTTLVVLNHNSVPFPLGCTSVSNDGNCPGVIDHIYYDD